MKLNYLLKDFALTKQNKSTFILSLALLVTIFFLVLTGFLLNHFVHYQKIPLKEFAKPFCDHVPSWSLQYGPQRRQQLLFTVLALLSPIYSLLALWLSKKIHSTQKLFLAKKYITSIKRYLFPTLTVVFFILILNIINTSSYVQSSTHYFLLNAPGIYIFLCVVMIMYFCGYFNKITDKTHTTIKIALISLAIAAILFHAFSVRLINFNFLSHLITWKMVDTNISDVENVYYPLAQVIHGKTLLSNLPTLYGLFPEILSPFFRVIGLSLFKFSFTMELLEALSFLMLLRVIYRITNSALLSCIFVFFLCYICGNIFLSTYQDFASPYYEYWPIRIIFPSLSLLSFCWLVHEITTKKVIVIGFLSAIALLWNIETGIAIFGATSSYFVCLTIFPIRNDMRLSIRCRWLLTYLISISMVLGLFTLYLETKSGFTVHWEELFKYPRIFYGSGLSQMPISMKDDMWMVVLLVYLMGLIYTFYNFCKGNNSTTKAIIFYISILGIGLFTYYVYRAHVSCLMAVSWPAILLSFIFASEIFTNIKQKKLPLITILITFPFIYLTLIMSVNYIYSMPKLFKKSLIVWQAMAENDENSRLTKDYHFIKNKLHGERETVVLLYASGILYGELALVSAVDGPGPEATYLKSDYNDIIKRMLIKPIKHVFIDANSEMLPYLLTKYRKEDCTSEGTLHLTPRKI